jgi:hypothetical protein
MEEEANDEQTHARSPKRARCEPAPDDNDDIIEVCIANDPRGPIRWVVDGVSTRALVATGGTYFAALLGGRFRESSSDGSVRIVLPLDDATPQAVVEALVRRAAGRTDRETDTALALLPAYGREVLSFLDLTLHGDDAIHRASRPDTEAGSMPVPELVLMTYIMRAAAATNESCPFFGTDPFSFKDGIDRVPESLWVPWARYGGLLFDAAARALGNTATGTCGAGRASLADMAICYLASKIDADERATALAGALLDALYDWRESMFLDSADHGRTIHFDRTGTVNPFVAQDHPDAVAWRRGAVRRPMCLVPDRDAFVRNLCLDFPRAGPLLLADGGPISRHRDQTDERGGDRDTASDARVVLAGGSVVNALQTEGLRCRLDSSDLDLWVIGSDPEARRAVVDRTVRWFFEGVPHGRCSAHVRDSIITLEIVPPDCERNEERCTPNEGATDSTGANPNARVECVQIIMTDSKTPDAVVAGFDMVHACAWFDGERAGATWDCLRAIATRTTRPLPGVRPLLSRHDKACTEEFVPTWDRADSPQCDFSWDYDDGGHRTPDDVRPRFRNADDTLRAFPYVPLVRRPPPTGNHGTTHTFIPHTHESIYAGSLAPVRFAADGTARGFCLSRPLRFRIRGATLMADSAMLAVHHDDDDDDDATAASSTTAAEYLFRIETDADAMSCLSLRASRPLEELAHLDCALPAMAKRYARGIRERASTTEGSWGDKAASCVEFGSARYRPMLCADDRDRNNRHRAVLGIVWTDWRRPFDGVADTTVDPSAVVKGSRLSGLIRVTGARLDDESASLCAMADAPLLRIYPPAEVLAESLLAET